MIRVASDIEDAFVVVDEMGQSVGSWRHAVVVRDPNGTFDTATEIVVEAPAGAQAQLGPAGRPDGVHQAGKAYFVKVLAQGELDPTGQQPPHLFSVSFESADLPPAE